MSERPATTVILPTVEWTDACSEVAGQLQAGDELLIVCDAGTDPVAGRSLPQRTSLVVAGEPRGCSGKANAVAAGMERATNDRIVWTDDDFHHPPDWLDTLHADYERHGPVSELPVYAGRDLLATLLEPTYTVNVALGSVDGGFAWGGGVAFERGDLDVAALVADLRRSVSDDGTLSEHLDVTTLRRGRTVPAGGSLRTTLERHVRFVQITRQHAARGFALGVLLSLAVAALGVLYPVSAAVVLTLVAAAVYWSLGVPRATVLLAYPSAVVQAPLLLYGLARRTFVWGGRRYRWQGRHDVTVVDERD